MVFSPGIHFLIQSYSLKGCFNVGNSEHVKDAEAKIIIQVPKGSIKLYVNDSLNDFAPVNPIIKGKVLSSFKIVAVDKKQCTRGP